MIFVNIALFLGAMLIYGLHYFTILQADGYKIKPSYKTEQFFLINSLVIILFSTIITILVKVFSPLTNYIILSSFLFILIFILTLAYIKKRNKLVFTARGKRLFIVYGILIAGICGIFFIEKQYVMFCAVFFFLLLSPLICCLAYKITLPFENRKNRKYVENAKTYLAQNNLLVKIGITGSYGKTSCKNILNELLATSYNVYATKASYNTPLGIAKSTKEINKATDIFIAEMGARKTGDIKELVDIVKPKYAILTGVTRQHLETFLTMENIYKEKQELVSGLPEDGFCVFNGENCYTKHMYYKCKAKKCIVGFSKNFDIYADNIKTSSEGSEFDIVYADKIVHCRTKLLGKHNILNILLCYAMAKKFKVKDIAIKNAISSLEATKHRMELVKTENGITVIDDSYNCNIEGAVAAFETLCDFSGRKVIFSQGIVEAGAGRQEEMNKYLGRLISKVADVVILCSSNAAAIKKGLEETKFNGEIYVYKNLMQAKKNFQNILKVGDTLLMQNDLPDNY